MAARTTGSGALTDSGVFGDNGSSSFTSTDLAGMATAVSNALAPIDSQTAIIESMIKSVVQTFDTGNAALNAVLSVLGGGSHLSVSVDLVLKQAVSNALATPGVYEVTALQVAITIPFGNLAVINFATSRIGANSLGATPPAGTAAAQWTAPASLPPVAGTVVKATAGTATVPDVVNAANTAAVGPKGPETH